MLGMRRRFGADGATGRALAAEPAGLIVAVSNAGFPSAAARAAIPAVTRRAVPATRRAGAIRWLMTVKRAEPTLPVCYRWPVERALIVCHTARRVQRTWRVALRHALGADAPPFSGRALVHERR